MKANYKPAASLVLLRQSAPLHQTLAVARHIVEAHPLPEGQILRCTAEPELVAVASRHPGRSGSAALKVVAREQRTASALGHPRPQSEASLAFQ